MSAMSGFVKRPYIEAKRTGAKGFLVGVYSGSTGLVLKPISGCLDLLSKSAEGIKNTVKIFEAQVYNDRRRLPRTFYGQK
jgi:vacuolar protein sorting-associated protein 13A/C